MKGNLYILYGPSGSGKSTIANWLTEQGIVEVAPPKYTERPPREEEEDKDVLHVQDIETTSCDILYTLNDFRYGMDSNAIRRKLERGQNLVTVLSDLRVVRRLKQDMGSCVRLVFVASPIDERELEKINRKRHGGFQPTDEQRTVLGREFARLTAGTRLEAWNEVADAMANLFTSWRDALPGAKSLRVRIDKIRQFHNRYIDNIGLFDHVILNFDRSSLRVPLRQAENVLQNDHSQTIHDRPQPVHHKPQPVIFMVCAPPGAGKGTLMENLNIMGKDKVRIVTKMAKRSEEATDKRDGMVAIGDDGVFPEEFGWRWVFHGNTEYAVSVSEINANIASGHPQIFISNMSQMSAARALFGDRIVFLYLHSTLSEDQRRAHFVRKLGPRRAEERVRSADRVFLEYVDNITHFDHVLLNTTYPEDLYDQMFRLLEHYS